MSWFQKNILYFCRENIKHFFPGLFVLLTGLGIGLISPAEAGIIDVYFADYEVHYTLYTMHDGRNEYVHLDKVSQLFRLSEEIDPIDGRVVLRNDEKSVSFFPGQGTVIANRRSYFLDAPPKNVDGVIMVPITFLTEIVPLIYEGEIFWDPGRRLLQVGIMDLRISGLYASPYGEYTRIFVDMNQAPSYKVTEKLPSRLMFELPFAQLAVPQAHLQVNSPAVEYVKLIDSFGATQLVVKLGPEFQRYRHLMLEDPPRLLVDIYNTAEAVVATPTPDTVASGITEEDITQESIPLLSGSQKTFSLQTVVIDPGHGGSDSGITISALAQEMSDVFEKDITLKVAQMLSDSLQHRFGGVRVVLTREGDSFVGTEQRTTIANNNRADVFLSVHVNNSQTEAVSGFEVYVMDYGSLELPEGYETLSAQSQSLDYAQARHIDSSNRLAENIITAYNERANGGHLKSAPLFSLKGATMPAVHIEIGYGSNEQDRVKILQKEFQQLLVAAITDGLAAFREQEEQ